MVQLERAGVKDHGVVTALLVDFALSQGWEPEVDRDRWDRVIAELLNSDSWLFVVASNENGPVGIAAVNFYLTLYGSREQARLAALFVDERHRGAGTGGLLLEEALASARRRGCRQVEAGVESGGPMEEFLKRHGGSGGHVMMSWEWRER